MSEDRLCYKCKQKVGLLNFVVRVVSLKDTEVKCIPNEKKKTFMEIFLRRVIFPATVRTVQFVITAE